MRQTPEPAFPRPASMSTADWGDLQVPVVVNAQDGMTLRDWFAGHSMTAILPFFTDLGDFPQENVIAPLAYRLADAMMKARKIEPE